MPWTITELHPLLIHFPIALFSAGLIFDILAHIFEIDDLESAGFYTMCMGIISSGFAIISGMLTFFEMGSISDLTHFTHGLLQYIATLLLIIIFMIRIKFDVDIRFGGGKKFIYLLLHFFSVGLLFYGSHLGAKVADRI